MTTQDLFLFKHGFTCLKGSIIAFSQYHSFLIQTQTQPTKSKGMIFLLISISMFILEFVNQNAKFFLKKNWKGFYVSITHAFYLKPTKILKVFFSYQRITYALYQ